MKIHKKNMQIGNKIQIIIFESDNKIKKYKGIVESEIEEEVYPYAKKGDFWIDVKKLGKKLIGKNDCLFSVNKKPTLMFDNRGSWVGLN